MYNTIIGYRAGFHTLDGAAYNTRVGCGDDCAIIQNETHTEHNLAVTRTAVYSEDYLSAVEIQSLPLLNYMEKVPKLHSTYEIILLLCAIIWFIMLMISVKNKRKEES